MTTQEQIAKIDAGKAKAAAVGMLFHAETGLQAPDPVDGAIWRGWFSRPDGCKVCVSLHADGSGAGVNLGKDYIVKDVFGLSIA